MGMTFLIFYHASLKEQSLNRHKNDRSVRSWYLTKVSLKFVFDLSTCIQETSHNAADLQTHDSIPAVG